MLRISQQLLGDQWERKQIVAKGIWVLNFPHSVHNSETVPGRKISVWQMIVDIDGCVCECVYTCIHLLSHVWACNIYVTLCGFNICAASIYLVLLLFSWNSTRYRNMSIYTFILRVCVLHVSLSEIVKRALFALVHLNHILPQNHPLPRTHPHMSNLTVVTPPSVMYTHIHRLARRAWLVTQPPDPRQCRCVGPVVPQHSERPRSVPAMSRTHIEGILFVRLGKDQSSRTLIATMCNFPPLPSCATSYSFGF